MLVAHQGKAHGLPVGVICARDKDLCVLLLENGLTKSIGRRYDGVGLFFIDG